MFENFLIKMGLSDNNLLPLEIEYFDNIVRISINKDMTYDEFIVNLNSLGFFAKDNINKEFIVNNNLLKKGYKIILYNNEVSILFSCALEMSYKFCLYFKEVNKNIHEISLISEKRIWDNASTFSFKENLKGLNEKRVFDKYYNANLDGYEGNLNHSDAINLIVSFLMSLNKYRICEFIPMDILYDSLNIVKSSNVVISDDIISLSWKKIDDNDSINEVSNANFEIVLNETQESVGVISFDYNIPQDDYYFGNVSYEVFPLFRNKGYASRSLKLLKEVVKNNCTNNKDLYISIKQSNVFSEQVAIKNGGELFFKGEVPFNVIYLEEDRDINIYRIKI